MDRLDSRTLVKGFTIGLSNNDLYISIPSTLWHDGVAYAKHVSDTEYRRFTAEDIVVKTPGQPNKLRQRSEDGIIHPTYTLYSCWYRKGTPYEPKKKQEEPKEPATKEPAKLVIDLKPV